MKDNYYSHFAKIRDCNCSKVIFLKLKAESQSTRIDFMQM